MSTRHLTSLLLRSTTKPRNLSTTTLRPLTISTPYINSIFPQQNRRITTTRPTNLSKTKPSKMAQVTIDRTVAGENFGMDDTSGTRHAVWIATEPYANRPSFPKLDRNLKTDVLVVGAGISGISTAYEAVQAGLKVTLIEAREVLSGETGRTSGHLSSVNGDPRYADLIKCMYTLLQ